MTAYVAYVPGGTGGDPARGASAGTSSAAASPGAGIAEMRGCSRKARKERGTAKQSAPDAGTSGMDAPGGSAVDASANGERHAGGDSTPSPDSAAERGRPRADCTADSAGGLTFDIRFGDGAHGEAEPRGDAALLLRLRGGGESSETVRLPLGPAEPEDAGPGPDGETPLRAVLPSTMSLPEGRWDAYLAVEGEEPKRLLPGVHDLRSLVDRVPRQGRTWLGVRIPYATKYGNLTVRSWLRWPHAEAGALRVGGGALAVRGRLYGARPDGTATLEARPRGGGGEPVSVPLRFEECGGGGDGHGTREHGTREGFSRDGGTRDGGTHAADADHSEGPPPRFTARLPLDALPPGPRVWNLWVRSAAGQEPVRLARILDDVPDKKDIFSYPPQRVEAADGSVSEVTPYYTLDNDLSVRVSSAERV